MDECAVAFHAVAAASGSRSRAAPPAGFGPARAPPSPSGLGGSRRDPAGLARAPRAGRRKCGALHTRGTQSRHILTAVPAETSSSVSTPATSCPACPTPLGRSSTLAVAALPRDDGELAQGRQRQRHEPDDRASAPAKVERPLGVRLPAPRLERPRLLLTPQVEPDAGSDREHDADDPERRFHRRPFCSVAARAPYGPST